MKLDRGMCREDVMECYCSRYESFGLCKRCSLLRPWMEGGR